MRFIGAMPPFLQVPRGLLCYFSYRLGSHTCGYITRFIFAPFLGGGTRTLPRRVKKSPRYALYLGEDPAPSGKEIALYLAL